MAVPYGRFGTPQVVTGQQIADFLGQGTDAATVALAGEHLRIVAAFIRNYTRGQAFATPEGEATGEPYAYPDVAAVLTAATARSMNNPEQAAREQVADYSIVYPVLHGFSLPELIVLNSYRRRTA